MKRVIMIFRLFVICLWTLSSSFAQQQKRPELPATLGLDLGYIEFETDDFFVKIVKSSQTLAALIPKESTNFDFTPSDMLESRAADGFYHLGDLTLRLRLKGGDNNWDSYSTADQRNPVSALAASGAVMALSDLTPTLPEKCPLKVHRSWDLEKGDLVLKFVLKNTSDLPVEIGALGIPMVFNNILSRRSLEQAHEICSFFDPYIGQDAGYLQITRLSGLGPALLVVPEENTSFEAYRMLSEPMRPRQTFEGTFEWMVHSLAFAEEEWINAQPWNPPTAAVLNPGQQKTYSIRFLKAPEIRAIEDTLIHNNRPVAVGIPGYILPMDQNGKLFLKYPEAVAKMSVEPQNALHLTELTKTDGGWASFNLIGQIWGRARLTVTYEDGLEQSIHFYVIKPARQAVEDLGQFLMTKQWYDNPSDPFHRSPSVISYDRSVDKIVEQDGRVWIAGLGDEGGSGSWVAAAMKQFGVPNKDELVKYEQFVNGVLWGGLQYVEGEKKYGVRKSLFYYEPEVFPEGQYNQDIDWTSWTSWNKESSELVNRSYNYPHVAAAYWTLYRLARNYTGLVNSQTWEWFLDRAYQTSLAMDKFAKGHSRHGQMEGTVFVHILRDLKRENWTVKANELENTMKKRTDIWIEKAYPFGSEMAWDSTGQEEVYAWCKYFGADEKAQVSLNSILGYMPTVPHWGYNGNARRYWDFLYGGKLRRIERQLHHYGSGLNAIPVLHEYRENPDDFYLLRVGYGGMMGALTNIDQEGFASAAFHSFPSLLDWDAYSGDYGPNFFGHSINTATYVICHHEFGWQVFGGNVEVDGKIVKVQPLDSFRKRIFIAPLGLWLTLDSGTFDAFKINTEDKSVELSFSPAEPFMPTARLRIEDPTQEDGLSDYAPEGFLDSERGAFVIPLQSGETWISLSKRTQH